MPRDRFIRNAAALWCAVATGTLLFSAIVAPMLFDALPGDRATAGRIAARGFEAAYVVALAAALVVCIACWLSATRRAPNLALGAAMLVGACVQLFWVAPSISRRGAGWPGSFASLHATGGGLHLLLGVLALVLAWRLLSEA
jgi:Domain of unknown function (DUF4149)